MRTLWFRKNGDQRNQETSINLADEHITVDELKLILIERKLLSFPPTITKPELDIQVGNGEFLAPRAQLSTLNIRDDDTLVVTVRSPAFSQIKIEAKKEVKRERDASIEEEPTKRRVILERNKKKSTELQRLIKELKYDTIKVVEEAASRDIFTSRGVTQALHEHKIKLATIADLTKCGRLAALIKFLREKEEQTNPTRKAP
eukprot:TRINITY_DN7735_c0_g1_i1.p1 TRINITY_DN7735_c0_g1~~TRINITY_DN7735_c0_g1_i1.p1  ORF type:complete len:202 (-),score=26.14 TRINITY_DN7735_c0_g1_i1:172-777(-)